MNRLWNRNFFLLWQGQLVSLIGVQANQIAVMFWIKHATDSATLMGLLMMAAALPAVILEPLGGVLADRWSRKRIIVWCDLLSGLLVGSVGLLLWFRPNQTNLIIVCLFVSTTLVGVLQAFFRPAITASIPDIVPPESLAAANSLNHSSLEVAQLIGAGVGGILFRILGAPWLLMLDGISYLFSSFSETFVTIPQPARDDKSPATLASVWRDLAEGFGHFWRDQGLRVFFGMFALHCFFLVPCIVMLPFYVEDYLGLSTDWYGYLLAANGLGALVGYAVAGSISLEGRRRSRSLLGAYLVCSVLVGTLGITHSSLAAMSAVAAIGLLNAFIHVNFITIVQQRTPAHLRGRLFGIVAMVSVGLSPFAMGLTGVVADALHRDVGLLFRLCGAILTLIIVGFSSARSLRAFLASSAVEPSAVAGGSL